MKTTQHSFPHQTPQNQRGFSLIEILVGLAIGLLATLVIMQVFTVFEGQKRTTTGSADAQTNGSIAIYSIQHELKMAGFGLLPTVDASPLSCTGFTFGATGITSISPVTITDGGTAAGASDSITVRYGNSASGGVPSQIKGTAVPGPNDISVDNNLGCHVNDVALIVNGATCNLTSVTGPTDIAVPPVASSPPATGIVTLQNTTGAIVGANLACLGSWVTTTFQINPNYDPTVAANSQAYLNRNGSPSVADIVNIQAQYGVSASAGSNQITQWVNAIDGQASGNWGPGITIPDRNRIKAVRVAVVARNGLYEKGLVTNTCTTAQGTINKGPCAWDDTTVDAAPKIDLSKDTNWQHYRYRVFETIIPLRNMIWARGTL
ncbi:MAG: PilW family protein [Gallionella sp.]